MQVFPLSEGVYTIGHDKQFLPFDPARDVLTDRPRGSLLVEVQPFLVRMQGALLLLDAGLGFNAPNGEPGIWAHIRSAGFEPAQVTHILMSHLHKDHSGGLIHKRADGTRALSFPSALHCIYGPEAEAAMADDGKSYHKDEIEFVLAQAHLQRLQGERGTVLPGVQYRHSGGHSAQHIVYILEEGGETVFYGGDEAPQLRQMKVRYQAKYDFDGKRAMELREQYGDEGREQHWQFLFYHDISTPVSRL